MGGFTSNFGRFVEDVGEIAEGSDSTSISFTEGLETGIDSLDSTIFEDTSAQGYVLDWRSCRRVLLESRLTWRKLIQISYTAW